MEGIDGGAPSPRSQNDNSDDEDYLVNQLEYDVSNPVVPHACSEMSSEEQNSDEDKCIQIHHITESFWNQNASTEEQYSELSNNIRSANENSDNEMRRVVIVHSISDVTEPSINQQSPRNDTLESFNNIQEYSSDSSDSSVDSESDSDDSSSDSDSSSDESEDEVIIIEKKKKVKRKPKQQSWQSILGIGASIELPDISTLNLDEREEFMHMGNLESIIDTIVTVGGLRRLPTYDLDTLLFLDEGRKILGYVLDVMGPVTDPVYILQMSSVEAIMDLKLGRGVKVYCAPRSQYTKYVHLDELIKNRGSDASWIGDREVPIEYQEYSDDELELLSIQAKREKRKRTDETEQETPSMDRLPQGGTPQSKSHSTPNQDTKQQNNMYQDRVSRPNFRNSPQVNTPPNPQRLGPSSSELNRFFIPTMIRPASPQFIRTASPQFIRTASPQFFRTASPQFFRTASPQVIRPSSPQVVRPPNPWNALNPVAFASMIARPPSFAFNPSVPPPGFGMPAFFPMLRPMGALPINRFILPGMMVPRGPPFNFGNLMTAPGNGGNNRPSFRPNMPGPSDGKWFNQ